VGSRNSLVPFFNGLDMRKARGRVLNIKYGDELWGRCYLLCKTFDSQENKADKIAGL